MFEGAAPLFGLGALVTGAGRGIGYAIAQQLAALVTAVTAQSLTLDGDPGLAAARPASTGIRMALGISNALRVQGTGSPLSTGGGTWTIK